VVLEGHIVEMFNYVDLLVHASSTTALEAHFKNIPSISLCDDDPRISLLVTLSPIAKTFDELDHLVSNTKLGNSNASKEIVTQLENELYGKIDGKACLRAAQLIDQYLISLDTNPFRYPNDRYKSGVMNAHNPYGQSASEEEVNHYYHKIKECYEYGIIE